jgi:hypothetical protein
MNMKRGIQITGTRSPRQLNFVWHHIMFAGPQYATCFMSPIWNIEFLMVPASLKYLYTLHIEDLHSVLPSNYMFCESWCSSKAILYCMSINKIFPVFCTFLTDFDQILEPVSWDSLPCKPTSVTVRKNLCPYPPHSLSNLGEMDFIVQKWSVMLILPSWYVQY